MCADLRRICLIGESGPVSAQLQLALTPAAGYQLSVLSSRMALSTPNLAAHPAVKAAHLVILCVQDFASPQLVAALPATTRLLDISPAFRLDPQWVYGLPELPEQRLRLAGAQRVANPGCFATAALLLIAPLQAAGLLVHQPFLYLDAVGGYSAGGAGLTDKSAAGTLAPEAVYSLRKEHRHIAEVQQLSNYPGQLWFTPKIADYPQGTRLQVPLHGVSRTEALAVLSQAYREGSVEVFTETPATLAGDSWAGRPGAGIFVIEAPGGCLAVCLLDNLKKGASDAALANVALMLSA